MRVTSKEILNEPIAPVLRRMTIPVIIGILSMFAFQAVDTFFISMLGTEALAAISFTFPVTFTVMSLTLGMSIAVSVIVGKAIGQGDHDQAARLTTDSIGFAVLLVIALAIPGYFTIDALFSSLGATENTLPYIHEYMDIWYIYVAFLVIPMVGNSALRATGDTKWPSILMMVGGAINAILDPILIFGFGPIEPMGVTGAAWATVWSWVVGFFVGIWLLGIREKLLVFNLPDPRTLLRNWWQLLKLGMPISIANMLTPLSIGAMTAIIATHGEQAVAAYGAGGRIESFGIVAAMALTAALSPYMAQNIGANKIDRAHHAFVISCKFVIKIQLVMWAILALFAGPLARIFTEDPAVFEITRLYLWVMPAGAAFYGIMIVLNTAFNAHHDSNKTLLVSLARLILFVVPLAWAGNELAGIPGLFAGNIIGNILSALFGAYVYRRSHYVPEPAVA
jgi:putative MATE family efflux protein